MRVLISSILIFLLSFELEGQRLYSDSASYPGISKIRKDKKFKFSKKKFHQRIDFNKIDTNAVYVFSFLIEEVSMHRFYRFFDSKAYISYPYLSRPSIEEFKSLDYGDFGFYTIDKDGMIVIETAKRSEMDSRWFYHYGVLYDDRIELVQFTLTYPNFWSSPNTNGFPWVFYKQEVDFKK